MDSFYKINRCNRLYRSFEKGKNGCLCNYQIEYKSSENRQTVWLCVCETRADLQCKLPFSSGARLCCTLICTIGFFWLPIAFFSKSLCPLTSKRPKIDCPPVITAFTRVNSIIKILANATFTSDKIFVYVTSAKINIFQDFCFLDIGKKKFFLVHLCHVIELFDSTSN